VERGLAPAGEHRGDHPDQADDHAAPDPEQGDAQRVDLAAELAAQTSDLTTQLPQFRVDAGESGIDTPREVVEALIGPGGPFHGPRVPRRATRNARGMDQSSPALVPRVWRDRPTEGVAKFTPRVGCAAAPRGGAFGVMSSWRGAGAQGAAALRRALTFGFAATWLALAALASDSSAEPSGFSKPVNLSGTGAGNPEVAVDSRGRALVIWERHGRINAVRVNPAGDPGPVQTVFSRAGRRTGCEEVAVDPRGRATVVWTSVSQLGDRGRVKAVHLDARGNPGPVHTLFKSADLYDLSCPRVAVDPEGRATVVFWSTDGVSGYTLTAVQHDPAGNPGPARTLSEFRGGCGVSPDYPLIAVDPDGRATVVWAYCELGVGQRVDTVRLDSTGDPGPVQTMFDAGIDPELAVDADGRATIVWRNINPYPDDHIEAVRLDAAANPGPIQTLAEGSLVEPRVAVDPEGRATVVWLQLASASVTGCSWHLYCFRLRMVHLDAAGNPGPVQLVSKYRDNCRHAPAEVAGGAGGLGTIVWRCADGSKSRVKVVRVDAGGDLDPVQTVGETYRHGYPQIAVDPEGKATVVWLGANGRVQTAHSLRLFEVDGSWTRLTLNPGKRRVRYYVRAYNRDTEPSGRLRLCVSAPENRLKILGGRCEAFDDVGPGGWVERRVKLKILKRARGKLTRVETLARGPNVRAQTSAWLRVRRRPAPPDPYPYGRDSGTEPAGAERGTGR
jgi:hypothetical protein